jgi:hypothetical protein
VNSTVRLLALIAIALAGLIAIELILPSGNNPEAAGVPETQTAETDAAPQGGNSSPADFAATILARPLFRPDRHPFPTGGQEVSTAPVDLPRLTGILMSDDIRRAIFAPDGADKAIVVAVGESVGDWRVQEIAADSVTMVGPDGTRRLRPKFAANPAPAIPGAPDATPPEPVPPVPAAPLPQVPKRGAILMNARRHHNDNMRPPQRKH